MKKLAIIAICAVFALSFTGCHHHHHHRGHNEPTIVGPRPGAPMNHRRPGPPPKGPAPKPPRP